MTLPDPAHSPDALDALVKDRENRHEATGRRFLERIHTEIDSAAARRKAANAQLDDNDNFGL